MRRRTILAFLVLLIGAFAFAAVGCGGDDDDGDEADVGQTGEDGGDSGVDLPDVTALPSASCTDIEFEGEGEPDVLIASDLPLQGSSRTQTLQMVGAIRQVLSDNGWKAGDVNVGYQSCDDSTAQAGKWDPGKTSQNANSYAENQSVIGVMGTFNSGAAAIMIPVLNQAPGGGLAMISPANTYVCLTEGGPGCADDEPDKYYPAGTRNYTRVVAHDAFQGAALAEFMQAQGTTSLYVLNDKEAYGLGVATNVRNAAEHLGIEVPGFEAWDPKASNYEALMRKISQSGADGVFFGGLIDENGAQVIKDKVKVLGDNETVKLYMPDGFTTQQTIDEAGVENTRGAFFSVAGVPVDEFTGRGAEFIEAFQETLGGEPVDPYAVYGAQAAQVLLDAIAASDYTRQSVIEQMFQVEVEDGFLGSFSFSENGDPELASGAVVGFTIYRGEEELEVETVISPQAENVEAAGGS
ncbi:MAG TPA: branched-chain amino acid ABC transporter substrate-binding protein [Gaiellaceae bacterium]|nr:branched-chain amino acid ABC transporter substrate-binding protein [Gaiellaceae bacterium]